MVDGIANRRFWMLAALTTLLSLGCLPEPAGMVGDWEQVGPPGDYLQIYSPSGGGLLVRTARQLYRSNDGGASWSAVGLPAGQP